MKSTASRASMHFLAAIACALAAACASQQPHGEQIAERGARVTDLAASCQVESLQAVASGLSTGVSVQSINDGPRLPGGVRYVAAAGDLPAYCQVTGSFVTNPATGKTANFLAAFPANWNGKYLQVGCSGHCGNFAVSDVTSPTITITNQGRSGDALVRGYAAFATDEGHEGFGGGAWAIDENGGLNQDALDDFLYRAQMVLSRVGKEFTIAFYARATGTPRSIARSYFAGCSGGGRDALVAAAYFPEQFDGIIAGSPYINAAGVGFQGAGIALAGIRSADADVGAALAARVDPIVKAQCDGLDGVSDGLIQNPAACNFLAERDLPRCAAGAASGECFTQAQIETISTYLTAVTDENGQVVLPGFSVSEMQANYRVAAAPVDGPNPWPNDNYGPGGGLWALANANLKIFVHRNDPNFHTRSVISYSDGAVAGASGFRIVAPRVEVDRAQQALRMGIGADADTLIRLNRRMLIWSNLSDEALTPYMATNYYQRLAERHGGYARLQRNVRLFQIPGSSHCSMGGVGPNNFDALGAMEAWVERGQAPNALPAGLHHTRPSGFGPPAADFTRPPIRTMPLCAYPAMARYNGSGDVNDAANWSCPARDRSMLTLGESGRRAGLGR